MKIYKGKKVYHTKFKSDEGSKSIKDKTRRVFEYEGYCEEKTGRCHGTGKMTQVVIDNKTGKNITTPTKQEGELMKNSRNVPNTSNDSVSDFIYHQVWH